MTVMDKLRQWLDNLAKKRKRRLLVNIKLSYNPRKNVVYLKDTSRSVFGRPRVVGMFNFNDNKGWISTTYSEMKEYKSFPGWLRGVEAYYTMEVESHEHH